MTTTAKKTLTKKAPSKQTKAEQVEQLDQVLDSLYDKRAEAADIADDISRLQSEALNLMDKLGVSSHSFKDASGKTHKATRQQQIRQVIDEDRLKKKIGLSLWNKITVRKMDKSKLDAFVKTGEIKAQVLADCVNENPAAPFVKVN